MFNVPKDCSNLDGSNENWLLPATDLDSIENPDQNHAYILPDKKVYIYNGEEFVLLNANDIANIDIATAETLGVIKVGKNLTIDSEGSLSAEDQEPNIYSFVNENNVLCVLFSEVPETEIYKIIINNSVTGSDTTIDTVNKENYFSLTDSDAYYTVRVLKNEVTVFETVIRNWDSFNLPIATSEVLGGVKVGTGLEITLDGILSVITSGDQSEKEIIANTVNTTQTTFSADLNNLTFTLDNTKGSNSTYLLYVTNNRESSLNISYYFTHWYGYTGSQQSGSKTRSAVSLASGAKSAALETDAAGLGYGDSLLSYTVHSIFILYNGSIELYRVYSYYDKSVGTSILSYVERLF